MCNAGAQPHGTHGLWYSLFYIAGSPTKGPNQKAPEPFVWDGIPSVNPTIPQLLHICFRDISQDVMERHVIIAACRAYS